MSHARIAKPAAPGVSHFSLDRASGAGAGHSGCVKEAGAAGSNAAAKPPLIGSSPLGRATRFEMTMRLMVGLRIPRAL